MPKLLLCISVLRLTLLGKIFSRTLVFRTKRNICFLLLNVFCLHWSRSYLLKGDLLSRLI